MKGDLIVNGLKMVDVDVYSMADDRTIQIYRENEDNEPTEYFHLVDASIYINHERLEISGYQYTGSEKQFRVDMPTHEEEFRFLTVLFYPYGAGKDPNRVYEPEHTYRTHR